MTKDYFNYFFSIIQNNLLIYIFILLIVGLVYFLLFKKVVDSLLDPMLLMVIACVFSTSDVIFMAVQHIIKVKFLMDFITTELALVIGIIVFSKFNIKTSKKINTTIDSRKLKIIYYATSILFNLCAVILFKKIGIQIGNPYRVNSLYGSGMYYTIISTIMPIYILIIVYISEKKKGKLETAISIVNLLIILFFIIFIEGSKSNLLILVSVFYFYILYLNNSGRTAKANILKKCGYVLLITSIILALFISIISSSAKDIKGGVEYLLYRFVAFGDVYPMYYLSSVKFVDTSFIDGIKLMVGPLITVFEIPLKIINSGMTIHKPTGLGIQLYQALFNTNIIAGPNSRHNVFSVFYFGNFFGVVFSFLLGALLGFTKKYGRKFIQNSILNVIIYMVVVTGLLTAVTDPAFGISRLIIQVGYLIIFFIFFKLFIRDNN